MEACVAEEKVAYNAENVTHQAHDKFFRTVMLDKRVARDFLQAYLPADIAGVIDFNNLELQRRSYLSDIRKESIVDMLFKTTLSGKEAFIFILVEHQSKPDVLMPFRMLKYIVNIIDDYLSQTKQKKLPLIYPMVVYHANSPYPYSTDIIDIIDAPRLLAEQYFLKPFCLVDLGEIKDEEIKSHAWSGIMEFALKHIFERDVLPCLKDIAGLMRRLSREGGEKYVEIVLEYLLERGEVKSHDEFMSLINKEISTEIGENVMTIAEQFRQEGRQEGWQEGRQEGRQEGMLEGVEKEKIIIAKRLLAQKFDLAFIAEITQLSINQIMRLEKNIH